LRLSRDRIERHRGKVHMPKILVNYRRDDSAAYAGRLADRPEQAFRRRERIQMVWPGAGAMPCFLYDETGTKPLSPVNPVFAWQCAKDMGLWDAAPGKYQIKFGDGVAIIAPLTVVVNRGRVTRVEPPVGQLRLHWNGSNTVSWYLLDKTGEKTLSIVNPVFAWTCEAGTTCGQDVGAGDYLVKVAAPGYQPVKVTIAPFRVTDVTIP
jgi:hypothetical protein